MQNLSHENKFYLHVKGNSFSYERLCTKTRFEKEVQGNSEMANCFDFPYRCCSSISRQIRRWFKPRISIRNATVRASCAALGAGQCRLSQMTSPKMWRASGKKKDYRCLWMNRQSNWLACCITVVGTTTFYFGMVSPLGYVRVTWGNLYWGRPPGEGTVPFLAHPLWRFIKTNFPTCFFNQCSVFSFIEPSIVSGLYSCILKADWSSKPSDMNPGVSLLRVWKGGGVLIPHSRSFFTRIPHHALFSSLSRFFFPKNTFKKNNFCKS